MKKHIGLALLIVALAFVAQWGYTGTVSPPAPIWAEYSAVNDVYMGNHSLVGADTVGVNTSFVYPDGTTGTTSPESCASGTTLNSSGCEALSNGSVDTSPLTVDGIQFTNDNNSDSQVTTFAVACDKDSGFCEDTGSVSVPAGDTVQVNFSQDFELAVPSITENDFYLPGSLSSDQAPAIAIESVSRTSEGYTDGVVLRNGDAGSSHSAEVTIFGIVNIDPPVTEVSVQNGILANFDAEDLSLTDNDQVSSWPSKGGIQLTHNDSYAQPVYQSSGYNSLPTVVFDGDDVLDGSFASELSQPFTVFVVKQYGSGADMHVWNDVDENSGNLAKFDSLGRYQSAFYSAVELAFSNSVDTGSARVSTVVGAGTCKLRVNGYESTASCDPASLTGIAMGYRAGSADRFFDGRISQLIVYNRELSASEIDQVESDLVSIWGIDSSLMNQN